MLTSGSEVWSQLANTRAAPKKIMRINALITAYVPDPLLQAALDDLAGQARAEHKKAAFPGENAA